MRAFIAPKSIYEACGAERKSGKTIGLVPTMGALHDGHLSLVSKSLNDNDVTVVSIFVNPIQFDKEEDLIAYPRAMEKDLQKLKELGVDILFSPEEKDMYSQKPTLFISFGAMEDLMEGRCRPKHFSGVAIVVGKLLNLVNPHRAYFGLKDLQQFLLIKNMVDDLSYQTEIVGVKTERETSGLAMSSRNLRLSKNGLLVAANIYKGLNLMKSKIEEGASLEEVNAISERFYEDIEGLEVEYLSVIDPGGLSILKSLDKINELAICFAGYVEGVRLIDNLCLRLDKKAAS